MAAALKDLGARFVLPFRFRTASGGRTSHDLIFVTKNELGYSIMKGIMASQSSTDDDHAIRQIFTTIHTVGGPIHLTLGDQALGHCVPCPIRKKRGGGVAGPPVGLRFGVANCHCKSRLNSNRNRTTLRSDKFFPAITVVGQEPVPRGAGSFRIWRGLIAHR